METRHVGGLPGGGGDPSPVTAYGVYQGIRAAARVRLGSDDVAGLRVAVQGVGHVGGQLCRVLREAGAALVVADIDSERARSDADAYGAEIV